MAHEASCWHTPAFVLLELALLHTEIPSVPLAFTDKMRDNTSLPLPLFLRSPLFLLQLSESLWDLLLIPLPFWTVVEPVLFSMFFRLPSLTLTGIRPANIEQSLLRSSSFQEKLSGRIEMLFSPNFPHFFTQKS